MKAHAPVWFSGKSPIFGQNDLGSVLAVLLQVTSEKLNSCIS